MIDAGALDLLFANENEIRELADLADRDSAIAALQDKVPLIVVTCGPTAHLRSRAAGGSRFRSPGSARASSTRPAPATCSRPASSSARRQGREPRAVAPRSGSIAAAEVISHIGARPHAGLKSLVDAL